MEAKEAASASVLMSSLATPVAEHNIIHVFPHPGEGVETLHQVGDSIRCWCRPELEQLCPLRGDEGDEDTMACENDCPVCHGGQWVQMYNGENTVLVKHNLCKAKS